MTVENVVTDRVDRVILNHAKTGCALIAHARIGYVENDYYYVLIACLLWAILLSSTAYFIAVFIAAFIEVM